MASESPEIYLPHSESRQLGRLELTFQNSPYDQTLEAAFSGLSLSTQSQNHEFGGGSQRFVGFGYGSGRNSGLERHEAGFDGGLRVGPGIDSWDTTATTTTHAHSHAPLSCSNQPPNLNGSASGGYLFDSRKTELFDEFSILPSPTPSQSRFFPSPASASVCTRGCCSNESYSNSNFNGNWLPLDSRQRGQLFNESGQNGILALAADGGGVGCTRPNFSRNKNVMRSSFDNTNTCNYNNQDNANASRRPPPAHHHWLQEPLNCLHVGDLSGRIVALSKDQYGCRFLQRAIDEASMEEIDMIFMEIIDHVALMMLDPFANYVVQKFVEVCSEEQKNRILLMVVKDDFRLVNICLNAHGSRAVQKLLEKLTTHQQISLAMSALNPGAVALTKDMNGHRIIQYCLKNFSDEDTKYLLNQVAVNCYQIATDKSGCCALQQCVDHSKGQARMHLIREIIANALSLAEDQYGNYVVQHMIGLKELHITERLLRQLEGNYASLSLDRYGSNVVEKCLTESGEQQSTRIIMELLRSPIVSKLLVDPYGNYVIQSAFKVSKGFVYHALLNLVRGNYQMMRSHVHGKWILRRLHMYT